MDMPVVSKCTEARRGHFLCSLARFSLPIKDLLIAPLSQCYPIPLHVMFWKGLRRVAMTQTVRKATIPRWPDFAFLFVYFMKFGVDNDGNQL